MTNDHGYPPMTADERALFARVGTRAQTDDDLIAAATFEADHAMRSLTPHCLPAEGGLPLNPDHANACAHRCWSFLKELAERRASRDAKPKKSKWLLPIPNCRGCGKENETMANEVEVDGVVYGEHLVRGLVRRVAALDAVESTNNDIKMLRDYIEEIETRGYKQAKRNRLLGALDRLIRSLQGDKAVWP
jgi:hypothetical protein